MIRYDFLYKAGALYEDAGYTNLEVPWWVGREIAGVTKPSELVHDNEYMVSLNNKCLIASGEQGFIYRASKGQLPKGKFHTITPCFRNEPHRLLNQKQFMKLELIEFFPQKVHEDHLNQQLSKMIETVERIWMQLHPGLCIRKTTTYTTDVAAMGPSFDLEILVKDQWIELGSYGLRQHFMGTWVYGTGLAEPRFSKILTLL